MLVSGQGLSASDGYTSDSSDGDSGSPGGGPGGQAESFITYDPCESDKYLPASDGSYNPCLSLGQSISLYFHSQNESVFDYNNVSYLNYPR